MNEKYQLCMIQIIKALHQRYSNSLGYKKDDKEDMSFEAGLSCAYFLALNDVVSAMENNGFQMELFVIIKQIDKYVTT